MAKTVKLDRHPGRRPPDARVTHVATKDVSAVRDLRDALVKLARRLGERRDGFGYLLVVDPRLSKSCIQDEVTGLTAAMRSDLANRFRLIVVENGEVTEKPADLPKADWAVLQQLPEMTADRGTRLPSPDTGNEVFLVILHQWLLGQGPMTSRRLEEVVGCNYRTVSAAVERLGPAIKQHSDRRVELKYFPREAWARFLAVAHKTRATMLFADASGQPRSPESLVRRLRRLDVPNVAVGGVLGAKRFYPDLDLTGAPCLDLVIHVPGKFADLDFIRRLDPALERTDDPHRPARLALRFIRRKESLFEIEKDGALWADPVECLLELHEARLEAQASEFAAHLANQRTKQNGKSR